MSDNAFGELIALHNLGCAELAAGRLDEAVLTLTEVVTRYRAQHSPNTMGSSLAVLSIALALRGDDIDLLPMAREGHVKGRLIGSVNYAILAAALQHVRLGDAERAAVIAGYSEADMRRWKCKPEPCELAMPGRVLDRCRGHLADEVIARLRACGAALDDRHAERVAFDGADWDAVSAKPLPGLGDARV